MVVLHCMNDLIQLNTAKHNLYSTLFLSLSIWWLFASGTTETHKKLFCPFFFNLFILVRTHTSSHVCVYLTKEGAKKNHNGCTVLQGPAHHNSWLVWACSLFCSIISTISQIVRPESLMKARGETYRNNI